MLTFTAIVMASVTFFTVFTVSIAIFAWSMPGELA